VAARCGFEVVGTDDAHTYGAGAGGSYPARFWELRRQGKCVDAQLAGPQESEDDRRTAASGGASRLGPMA